MFLHRGIFMEQYHHLLLTESIVPGLEAFIPVFCADRCVELRALKSYIEERNYGAAMRIMHQWKGFCEPYGFAVLGLLAADLEGALKKSDTAGIQKLILDIEKYFFLRKINSATI